MTGRSVEISANDMYRLKTVIAGQERNDRLKNEALHDQVQTLVYAAGEHGRRAAQGIGAAVGGWLLIKLLCYLFA